MHVKNIVLKNIVLLFFGLLYAGFSQADTYKWVDENGRTNFGDTVPEKYKARSEKVEIKENVVPANKTQSLPKAEEESGTQTENPKENLKQEQPKVLEMAPPKDLPTSQLKSNEDCEAQMQKYKESQECFAPYRTVRGGIKEEGVNRCTVVQQPDCTTSAR